MTERLSHSREFDWDDAKNEANFAKHRVSFELAHHLFESPTHEREDTRRDYGERRIVALGAIGGRVFAVVYTDRRQAGIVVRWIISLRKANARESRRYHEYIQQTEAGQFS